MVHAIALAANLLVVLAPTGTLPDSARAPAATHGEAAAAPRATVGYEEGFFLGSSDGRSQLAVEGLLQVNGLATNFARQPRDGFALRRMRLEFGARLPGGARARIEPNFTDGGIELEEAWVGCIVAGGNATCMFGRVKTPYSLEESRSQRHLDFPRLSLLNQFAPAEDEGFCMRGTARGKLLEYGIAIYNGTGGAEADDGKDVAGRLMLHPGARHAGSAWENLQLGVSGTLGNESHQVDGDELVDEAGQPFFRFGQVSRTGRRSRADIEGAYNRGPFFVQAEAMQLRERLRAGAGTDDVRWRGAYAEFAWSVFGESKSFGGVEPRRPFDLASGSGRGAIVLALRLAQLEPVGRFVADTLAVPGGFPGRVRSASVGLNWIPNANSVLRLAYVHTSHAIPIAAGDAMATRVESLLLQAQVQF